MITYNTDTIELFSGKGQPQSLSNLQIYPITKLYDAIEDSAGDFSLCANINCVSKIYKFTIDRITDSYVRFVSIDRLGNYTFLKVDKNK